MENKWHKRFMDTANNIAAWSKDTNTKVGAVIVNADKIVISSGYNGFPRGVNDSIALRFDKPAKYLYTEHAERNAIYSAGLIGAKVGGCTMYVTMFPCCDCTRGIIQTGVICVVVPRPDLEHPKWGESFKAALEMLEEAKVNIIYYEETNN